MTFNSKFDRFISVEKDFILSDRRVIEKTIDLTVFLAAFFTPLLFFTEVRDQFELPKLVFLALLIRNSPRGWIPSEGVLTESLQLTIASPALSIPVWIVWAATFPADRTLAGLEVAFGPHGGCEARASKADKSGGSCMPGDHEFTRSVGGKRRRLGRVGTAHSNGLGEVIAIRRKQRPCQEDPSGLGVWNTVSAPC